MTANADEGLADPRLTQARLRFEHDGSPANAAAVHAALLDSRLLVPVVTSAHRAGGSKETTMALVTLELPTGATAVVAFSSWAELKEWAARAEIDARPVSISARELLAAVVAESREAMVLDPASRFPLNVGGSELADLAAGYLAVAGAPWLAARASDCEPRPGNWRPPSQFSDAVVTDPAIIEAWSLVLGPGGVSGSASGSDTQVLGLLLTQDAVPIDVVTRLAAVVSSEIDITIVSTTQVAQWRMRGFRPYSSGAV